MEPSDKKDDDPAEQIEKLQLVEDTQAEPQEDLKEKAEGIENIPVSNELIDEEKTWDELGIKSEIKEGLIETGWLKPSKIQSTTFPLIMKQPYCHLVAQAKNGSGKTGAFGLGVISRIDESDPSVQAVIFAHTRELSNQIGEVLSKIAQKTKVQVTVLHSQDKKKEVGQVVVITPGNFENVFLKRKQFKLDNLKILVLDEADYMITEDVAKKASEKTFKFFKDNNLQVQVLFFSATYSKENFKSIKTYYKKAYIIDIKEKEKLTLENVKQFYYITEKREDKVTFIGEYLKRNIEQSRIIVFVNTRDYTVKLQEKLSKMGYKVFILMGGDMDPKNRDLTIKKFNQGEIQILITTNIIARGYDERLVQLVINFDVPIKKEKKIVSDPETYLHRIGRTGRFGSKGIALTLVAGARDKQFLDEIKDFYKSEIKEIKSLDELLTQYKEYLYQAY